MSTSTLPSVARQISGPAAAQRKEDVVDAQHDLLSEAFEDTGRKQAQVLCCEASGTHVRSAKSL
jgi:hypothetical protein